MNPGEAACAVSADPSDSPVPFAAIVFDFDGIILDTETHVFNSWRVQFQQRGHDVSIDSWIECLGRPGNFRDYHTMLEQLTGETFDRDAMLDERKAYIAERLAGQPAMPGVVDWLDAADERGVRLAVASGSSHEWVDNHLKRLGLLERFETIVCGEDTDEHKPLPAPFLEAARRLGVAPGRCIAIEDSPNGVAAASAAGMHAIAVPTSMTTGLAFPGAARAVDSLADLPLAAVLDECAAPADDA